MPKSVPALINPTMLVWARERARLTIEAAAEKAGISVEKLAACEAGDATLTFKQLMRLAVDYKRPVSLFYLKEPPKDWQPIQDFRRLPDVEPGFSAPLAYAIRQARERRELALELRSELSDPVRAFDLTATLNADVEALGQRIRDYLNVSESEQRTWKTKSFDGWRLAMEASDILVFVVPRVRLEEFRGVAIAERELPTILVNGRDRTNGRVFTLLHEFCHIVLRQSGVSGAGGDRDDAPSPSLERFCNAVAGAALMPKQWLLAEPLVRSKAAIGRWDDEELTALASRFGVSREAILRRLLTLGRTTQAFYESKRATFLKEYQDIAEQKSVGGPKYHIQVLSQLGRGFARLVFRGYHERRLTLRDVANHFSMQAGMVPEMERAAFGLNG